MILKAAHFALFLPLTLLLVYFGYQAADRGLDALENRRIVRGWLFFLAGVSLAAGSALFLPATGYWFVFERGYLPFVPDP